jgi:hypothetical protein
MFRLDRHRRECDRPDLPHRSYLHGRKHDVPDDVACFFGDQREHAGLASERVHDICLCGRTKGRQIDCADSLDVCLLFPTNAAAHWSRHFLVPV